MVEFLCIRQIDFCSGHRLMNHEEKCKFLHGHNYRASFYARAEQLDQIGRVVDFSVLKEKLKGWIDDHWDHKFILHKDDALAISHVVAVNGESNTFLLPYNPTAENMAHYLLIEVSRKVFAGTGITIEKVVLSETPNCSAEVRLKG
jgi:6-pyruvoyltetrahydropterin/6-carboxytetrahydropterin synthase